MKTIVPFLAIYASVNCAAQSPAAQNFGAAPAFEVASVRLADLTGGPQPPIRTTPESLTVRNLSLRNCIQMAYQIPQTQVMSADWLNDVRLDIIAKAAGPVDEQQLYLMLRTLLADRLGVKVHMDRKETAVYALTLAKGGAKFPQSNTSGPPVFGKDKSGPNMQRVSMSELASALSQGFGRPFVDMTGLNGRYDIRVDMTPYMASATAGANQGTPMDAVSILITALQEQMGLKIESRKEAIDILVVDHAEKIPSEN